ncbi:MAG: hypothetical protein M1586_02690 [Patescibacteria group bacterium]|nr:hypothetical protein [Patescibacteria group bacterium]MCL5262180.1 hypothetical protein [Patescibacteria group bacterium]
MSRKGLVIFGFAVVLVVSVPWFLSGFLESRHQTHSRGAVAVLEEPLAPPNYRETHDGVNAPVEVIITGYYKPLFGQKHYAGGSYEADLKMNGNGRTAIGEQTYIGSAASSNLDLAPFGSFWFVDGVGEVRVNDRKASLTDHLELDVFCGEGDTGLDAALALGRRVVKARRVSR